jgi:hypothetical protein
MITCGSLVAVEETDVDSISLFKLKLRKNTKFAAVPSSPTVVG